MATVMSSLCARRWGRCLFALLLLFALFALSAGFYGWFLLSLDRPVVYANIEDHFKYGSTGGERASGFPLLIFQAMPQVCKRHLPGGYASLGFIYEEGKELPVGMSQRNYQSIDRTFLNCAVCHSSTVRENPQAKPDIHLGMPANRFNIMGFQKFVFDCAQDAKFSGDFIVPEVDRLLREKGRKLGLIDRYVVYPVAVAVMRDRLLMLRSRFDPMFAYPEWGPGRVDTFNAAKVLFNFPLDKLPHEMNAPSDFPSIWLQQPREGMQLHWDGNNTKVEERNKSAAFGTGTTPPTLDRQAIGRIEKWLLTREPPKYPYAVDATKAAQGAKVYQQYCGGCHGASGRDFSGPVVGKVTLWKEVATDKRRLDSYTHELAANQSTLYAGYDWRFQNFRKTFGYANMPLDGLWLRAPYLHNGSVPTIRDLLEPAAKRPKSFYRGYDVYDQTKLGFVGDVPQEGAVKFFRYDTALPGNTNVGHEGKAYGTELSSADKDALVEYLKTF